MLTESYRSKRIGHWESARSASAEVVAGHCYPDAKACSAKCLQVLFAKCLWVDFAKCLRVDFESKRDEHACTNEAYSANCFGKYQ